MATPSLSDASGRRGEGVYAYEEDGVVVLSNVPSSGRRPAYEASTAPDGSLRITLKPSRKKARARAMPEEYRVILSEACRLHGVPFALAAAVMEAESGFDPGIVSRAGAIGLMQLMPATADEMGVENILDPRENIFGGVRYLALLGNAFGGVPELTVAAYNAGPSAVARADGVPAYPETKAYVARVMKLYESYKSLPEKTGRRGG